MSQSKQWTESDLDRFCHDKVGETLTLEFKSCGALVKDPKGKQEVGKDMSAIANAAGGTIVYGIFEKGHVASQVDEGFDQDEFSKEWLEQVIDSNVQPRIEGLKISVIPLLSKGGGRVAYVVEIPQAVSRAPHQAADGRYYKRANFENQIMQDYEVRDAFRRARWPELRLRLSVHDSRLEDLDDRAVVSFTLNYDVENHSTEPAYYSVCEVYIDTRLDRVTKDDSFSTVSGKRTLQDGTTTARVFQRRLMLPNDFPIIKEQIQRVATFHLAFYLTSATSLRFGVGAKVLAPGCEHLAFNSLIYLNNHMEIANMRAAD
jgi:hypothetical protein